MSYKSKSRENNKIKRNYGKYNIQSIINDESMILLTWIGY